MKRIILTSAFLALLSVGGAYAAAPEAVSQAMKDCCTTVEKCCDAVEKCCEGMETSSCCDGTKSNGKDMTRDGHTMAH